MRVEEVRTLMVSVGARHAVDASARPPTRSPLSAESSTLLPSDALYRPLGPREYAAAPETRCVFGAAQVSRLVGVTDSPAGRLTCARAALVGPRECLHESHAFMRAAARVGPTSYGAM